MSCLADPSKEVRSNGVHYIIEARKNINPQHQPLQFLPPKINFAAKSYTDMIDWSKEQKTEPPLTIQMTENEILESLEKPLKLPSYPCHTQDVERLVPVVVESCIQKVGYAARHCWILSTMESRCLGPKTYSKKDDM